MAKAVRPVAFNQDIKAVLPNSDRVDSDYLYWFLRSSERTVLSRGVKKGATVHSIRAGFIEGLQVPLPSIEEQRRIVDLLARADGIVRLRRTAIAKATELMPAIFHDIFGDPATNRSPWPVTTVGEVIESADYGCSTKAFADGQGILLVRMGNVSVTGDLDLEDMKYVDLPGKEIDRYRLAEGDILFNRTNSKELVGKTGLWAGELDAVAASYFIRMRVREDRLASTYLWAYLNSAHMKRVLFKTARGAIGQANINAKELRAFKLPLPPLGLQQKFVERIDGVNSIRRQAEIGVGVAERAVSSLLADAFRA